MSIKHTKFTITTILIFSLLVPIIPTALAEDICTQAQKANCTNIGDIDVDSVKKDCSGSVFQDFYSKVLNCKEETESQLEEVRQRKRSVEWYLSKINLDVRYLNYEIANLNLTISQLESEIEKREKAIKELNEALSKQKEILSEALRQVYEYDLTSYVEVLLGYGSLSDFGSKLMEMDKIQIELRAAMSEIQKAKDRMETEKVAMEKDKRDKLEYKKVQEYSKYSLAAKQEQQEYFLQGLTSTEALLKAKLKELEDAMSAIANYLFYWTGIHYSWSAIFTAVQRASDITNVREALLLGTLWKESFFGSRANSFESVWGTSKPRNFNEACPSQKETLLQISRDTKRDPDTVPLSYACAMGPAQFMPTTWRNKWGGYEKYISPHFPGQVLDPWRLDHALVGMAYYLARNGATSGNEREAVRRYLCGGKPSPCGVSYAEDVISFADEWQDGINKCGGLKLDCLEKWLKQKFGGLGIPIE